MAITLYRLFFINLEFKQLLYSFIRGTRCLVIFLKLFGVVWYIFCVIAHQCFRGKLTGEDWKAANFNTLGDTFLTMFQVFVGEGWHSIMQGTVSKTNKFFTWFFIIYVLFVGVLFSQLFVGIIINTFGKSEDMRQKWSVSTQRFEPNLPGQIQMIIQDICEGWKDREVLALLDRLGEIAEELVKHQRHMKVIQATKGGILVWASLSLQRSYKAWVVRRIKTIIDEAEEARPLKISVPVAMAISMRDSTMGPEDLSKAKKKESATHKVQRLYTLWASKNPSTPHICTPQEHAGLTKDLCKEFGLQEWQPEQIELICGPCESPVTQVQYTTWFAENFMLRSPPQSAGSRPPTPHILPMCANVRSWHGSWSAEVPLDSQPGGEPVQSAPFDSKADMQREANNCMTFQWSDVTGETPDAAGYGPAAQPTVSVQLKDVNAGDEDPSSRRGTFQLQH